MRRLKKTFTFIFFSLLTLTLVYSVVDGQSDPRSRLENLRREIDSLNTALEEMAQNERTLVERVNTLDRQIQTRRTLIRELQGEQGRERNAVASLATRIEQTQGRLRITTRQLQRTQGEVGALEDQIKRRAVFLYKKGRRETLRFLLSASDPADLLRRRVYVRRIQGRDRNNLESLRAARARQAQQQNTLNNTIAELSEARREREAAIARLQSLVDETEQERTNLSGNRSQIAGLLEQVRRDQASVSAMITEREHAAQQVEEWIFARERARTGGEVQELQVATGTGEVIIRNVSRFDNFAAGRGRLSWPVRGRVVRGYGIQRNAELNTETENPGIDIGAESGSEVLAVSGGVCTRITYLRGFGTTLLIDHGDGYYTVYAHLADVYVSEGERVQPGRVIGTVGTDSQTGNPTLHFQVWHRREKQDPLRWIERRG